MLVDLITNMTDTILLIFVLLMTTLLAPLAVSYAEKLSLMDISNHRSSHIGITPRGGGIVFIIVFFTSSIIYYLLIGKTPNFSLLTVLICALIMAVIGWLDDFADLSVKIRFTVQFLVVLYSCLFIPRIWDAVPVIVEKTTIVFAWMWFINLFNFMDGTDGYATQEAFFICIGLFLLSSSIGIITFLLGVSVLGFLRVNYPKAKIFMGDVGSIFLGYILGGFLIYSIAEHSITIVQAIILTSLFSVDSTYTLIKRGLQKKKIWKAHREHWYQRFNITGASHKAIFWIGVIYNLIILFTLFLGKIGYISAIIEIIISVALLSSFVIYIKRKEKFHH
jgi:UDP-N-acetylmuramyl pentapeptide phosphotransferase/UDP-N-acetylglucosamine-1-phosphate transferase